MIILREYQKATYKDLLKMLEWLKEELNLRDWSISLNVGEKPDWVNIDNVEGAEISDSNYMFSKIWIPLYKNEKNGRNPYQILAHEVLHVLTTGCGDIRGKKSEFISYRLDDILYRLYMGTHNKEIADIKDI